LSQTFLCILLTSNSTVSREIWIKHALVSFSKTSNSTLPSDSCYFEVFEMLYDIDAWLYPNYTRNHAIILTIHIKFFDPHWFKILIDLINRLSASSRHKLYV
jgi:hypothetical protein